MVKTRLQLLEGTNQRLWPAIKSIWKEGGFFRFYRGVLPELVGAFPTSSVMLASAEIAKRLIGTAESVIHSLLFALVSILVT